MAYRTIEVTPLSGALGAEISGIDLAEDPSPDTFAEIRQALLEYLVIFFRNQTLTPDQQIAFARRFGPLIVDPFIKGPEDRPELMVLVKDQRLPRTAPRHAARRHRG